jgi:hypothetical protein
MLCEMWQKSPVFCILLRQLVIFVFLCLSKDDLQTFLLYYLHWTATFWDANKCSASNSNFLFFVEPEGANEILPQGPVRIASNLTHALTSRYIVSIIFPSVQVGDHELASGDWREGEVLFPL